MPAGIYERRSLRERVFAKLEIQPNGCLLWTGGVAGAGYPSTSKDGKKFYVHRLMYEWFVGPIPPGFHVDHLCRTRHCAAPAHLEAVTELENHRRAGHKNRGKERCKRGHLFDEANTYLRRNEVGRTCRQCRRLRDGIR